jgi:uncharacterized protein (TIGR00251 family)
VRETAEARLVVVVKPRSSKEGVEKKGADVVVRVRAPPVEGAANERVVEVVAEFLGVKKSAVRIVRGETAKHKELAIAGVDDDVLAERLARLGSS